MMRLARAGFHALVIGLLVGCAMPADSPKTDRAVPAGHAPVAGGPLENVLYLPFIANKSARQYLPAVSRHVPSKGYLPRAVAEVRQCGIIGSDCAEPNGTFATAVAPTGLNRAYFGTVYTATNDAYDYYVVSLILNQAYTVTLAGGSLPDSPFSGQNDADLYVLNAAGDYLAESANYGQSAERLVFTPTVSGKYYLLAFAYRTPSAPATYRLEIRDRP